MKSSNKFWFSLTPLKLVREQIPIDNIQTGVIETGPQDYLDARQSISEESYVAHCHVFKNKTFSLDTGKDTDTGNDD